MVYRLSTRIHELQRVQKAAARLLTNKPRYSHMTPVMVDLHWLPVRFRIIFKVILFTFKAVHGTAPTYITNLLSFKQSRYNLRSVGNNILARPEIKSAKTTGDRAFAVAAPLLWNALPPSLRTIDNITSFKKELKTHLFHIFRYFRFTFFTYSLICSAIITTYYI